MSAYDRWLEAPYVEASRQEAEFERFCEREGVDPDDPTAQDRFEAFLEELGEAE